MIKIKKDYLIKEEFIKIKNVLTSSDFPWYYQPSFTDPKKWEKNKNDPDDSFFTHTFYNFDKVNSDWFPLLNPLFKKLNFSKLICAAANLTLKGQNALSNFHVDLEDGRKDHYTSIYYITTNNGYTLMKKGNKKINCLENKIATFHYKNQHKVVGQTDVDQRIIINLNYYI